MRRRTPLPVDDRCLVAIYDALLFLMVVILISVGMFLYSARTVSDGGAPSDGFYQQQAENQLAMVEGLSLVDPDAPYVNQSAPNIVVVRGGNRSVERLNETVGEVEAVTIGWLVDSYFDLRYEAETDENLTYDLENVTDLVDEYFGRSALPGTHHAWALAYEGEVVLFGSDTVEDLSALPEDRWAATSDFSRPSAYDFRQGGDPSFLFRAELRYFLWYP